MFRVQLDGLDEQVKLVGAIDFAGYAVIVMRRYPLGFGEVMEPINPMRGVISHDKHDARGVFRPGYQSEMIGAEVKHEVEGRGRRDGPTRSAVEGLPGGFLRAGYHHSAAPS
jgi:hypothetical protein